MKTNFLLLIMILSLGLNLNAQSFSNLWKDVNINLENNLPESAEASLNRIEQKAIKENNQKQLLKTFLYRFKIFSLQDENPIETSIKFAEENIGKLQEPEKSIFNIAIASLYETYLNENLYNINNQQIISNGQQPDMKFWSKTTFEKVIDQYCENALSDIEYLQRNTTKSYQDILTITNANADFDYEIEPTLYDYVVHRVISLQDNRTTGQQELYQSLIDFDKRNNYADAAIYNEVQKLKSESSNDFETYFNSLIKIKNENLSNPLVTSVMALQAEAVLDLQTTDNGQRTLIESLSICDEAMKLFPNSIGAKQCESIRSKILEKELTFSMQSVVLPNQKISASISYRNLTNPHYRIYQLSQIELDKLDGLSIQEIVKTLLKKDYIIENYIDIFDNNDYKQHTLSINLPELECGTYFIMFSKDDMFSKKEDQLPAIHSFQVSNLSFVTTKENNDFVIYVLDRKTGKPVTDVNVNIFKQTYDYYKKNYVKTTILDLTTGKDGTVKVANEINNPFHINLFKDDDKLLSDSYFYNYQDDKEEKLIERTNFFTDRAIYRPGQTIYFKGIILNQNFNLKELFVGKETKVVFKDSNWQEIATQTFITDEFGSFDGSFVIPNNLSSGYFAIRNESGYIQFKVEEYKRQTFEITFNDPDKSFKLNDEVELSGSVKAYAGFGLDNINYDYTIVRRTYFPYRFWWYANYDSNEKQITFGEGKTDENGNFKINFQLTPDKNEKDKLPVFEYIVTVNATNALGETYSKTYTLKASEIDLIIDIDEEYHIISKDDLDLLTFNVKNLKENPVKAKIIRKIYEITDDKPLSSDNRILIYEDIIDVNGNYGLFQNVNINLDKGRYVVELISANNEKAMTSIELTIIDYKSNKMPYETMCISYCDKKTAQPGEKVNFYLGSSAKDVNVYVMIKHGENVRFYDCKTINDKVLKFTYKVKEEDRGEISFHAFFVKENTINIVQHIVSVPYDNLKLDIQLDIERDDLQPSSEEKWSLTIKDHENEGVVANLMAGMYDASLDAFAKNTWNFNTVPDFVRTQLPKSDNGFKNFSCSAWNQHFRTYELFDYYLMSDIVLIPITRYRFQNILYSSQLMSASKYSKKTVEVGGVSGKNSSKNDEQIMEMRVEEAAIFKKDGESLRDKDQDAENQEMSLRENFNETAFFYPNLITNDDGSLTMSFTMPDALTRWNLMMLAYTKDLKVGILNKTFTTSKPLVIMSDMPRFVYENDTLWVVANVISQQSAVSSQQSVTKAKLEIFDALTMQPLDLILSEQEIVMNEIPAGQSQAVRWKVAFEKDMSLLALRFSVVADNFSDAEQHLLPVLSNEVFMTETYPLIVRENSEKTYSFDFDNNNERNQGVTLNICANPVWYAIQSLPYLSQETGQYADVAFNIFYANSLASYIAQNIPNFSNYIAKWKVETPDALMSALQKDENLKAIMLQETPWVLKAKSETEQMSMLANLLDINTIENKTGETLNLLKEKQSVNGGWSWIEGMPESAFITRYILEGFGKLQKMNVIDSLEKEHQSMVKTITNKAIDFISKAVVEHYNFIIKDNKGKYYYSYATTSNLFALSYFDFDYDNDFVAAKKYFIKKLKDDWKKLDFESQAKIALILHRNGENDAAQLIVKSLKERAQKSETLGMYWAGNSNYFSSASQVKIHTVIMEAFKEINPNENMLNEMKVWLLCNKRTNMWDNAQATVGAVYALLFDESTSLQDNKTTSVEITKSQNLFVSVSESASESASASESVSESASESVSVSESYYWDTNDINNISDIKINNKTDNLVWGGLFRQYFVSIDEVKKHESPLNVERNIYVERVNEEGAYLVPIENEGIKVGDKIVVNLKIESSQDMEFVFLKDLRAACLEPVEQMSRYNYNDGMLYYQSNSDTFMGFYFDKLPKGKHQVSYSMFVTKEGNFSNGYALIQCMYSPEFSAYSESMKIDVGGCEL